VIALVLCSDPRHPVWPRLVEWCDRQPMAAVTYDVGDLECSGADVLLLVSCTQIIPPAVRAKFKRCLVIHESALPEGRGWSPMAWQVRQGQRDIVVSLIECADPVDSGGILAQRCFTLEGHELADEINARRDAVRLDLMDWAVANPEASAVPQQGEGTAYRRLTEDDHRLDAEGSIAAQFDVLRACDDRFPAWFEHRGHRYHVALRKA